MQDHLAILEEFVRNRLPVLLADRTWTSRSGCSGLPVEVSTAPATLDRGEAKTIPEESEGLALLGSTLQALDTVFGVRCLVQGYPLLGSTPVS